MTQLHNLFTDGLAYEHMMGRWSRSVAQLFLPWLDVPTGKNWLDLGCGNGAFTEEIIAHCSPTAITGLDPSEQQLTYARSRQEGALATYLKGDAQALPFNDASFDVVAMALVISFLPEPDRAVGEMVRVCRSGGWVATYMWDLPADGSPIGVIYPAMRSMDIPPQNLPSAHASTVSGLNGLWQNAGLTDIHSTTIRIPVSFPDFEAFWATFAVPVGPQGKMIAAMPPEMRDALKARARELAPIHADGSISYEAVANAIVGRVP